jgi:hypothetical protein
MLDDIKIAYDPDQTIERILVDSDSTHSKAAFYLTRGRIPSNLLVLSEQSSNFRDAVIYYILDQADRDELKHALIALTKAISTLDKGDVRLLTYSEYAAALATAIGEPSIAARVIKRNSLSTASSLLKTIAMAISKQMPGNAFTELIKNSNRSAVETWTQLERPVLYPNG